MPRAHLFVCDNRRPEGGRPACASRGDDVAQALTEAVLAAGVGGAIAVTRCACLGRCFDGPVAVEYPAGRWWTDLSSALAPAVVAAVVADEVPAALAAHFATDDP